MGGVDVDTGGKGGKRSISADLNLIPFIDLLMVTVAFLLLTAVWVTNSRINADAQVPGPPDPNRELTPQTPEKVLHLHVGEHEFSLVWKQGSTVVAETKAERPERPPGDLKSDDPPIRFLDLGAELTKQWDQHGQHKDKSDKKIDQAVLHIDNGAPFGEVVGVLDALYTPKRKMVLADGKEEDVPVFNMTFSVR